MMRIIGLHGQYLAFAAWRTNVEIIAFALMANHIHELVACQE